MNDTLNPIGQPLKKKNSYQMRDIIFLVDDDYSFGELVQESLASLGEIFIFQDPNVFLEKLNRMKPGLVLLDLNLRHQEYNGFDLIKQIKSRPDSHLIPILMISGADDIYGEALDSGIEDYIQKPILPDLFLKKVEHVLFQNRQKIHTNALTGLPDIHLIECEIMRRFNLQKEFSLSYLDMDNFKAFNDEKGIKAGDIAIQILAKILLSIRAACSKEELFIGHLGGDDFFLLGDIDKVRKVVGDAYEYFQKDVARLFNSQEIHQKYYHGRDRNGKLFEIPLLTLSTVILNFNSSECFDRKITFHEISETVSSIKKKAKSEPGNSIEERNYF